MNQQNYFIRTDKVLKKINLEEIYFLESDDKYVHFYALHYSEMVRVSLGVVISSLPNDEFIQIHRSFVVALKYIDTIEKDLLTLKSVPNRFLPISNNFYPALIERIRVFEPE